MKQMLTRLIGTAVALGVLLLPTWAHAQSATETRIDLFDKHSNRGGYLIVNPNTGRVDTFDKYSNRKNSAVISPPPSAWPPGTRAIVTPYPSLRRSK